MALEHGFKFQYCLVLSLWSLLLTIPSSSCLSLFWIRYCHPRVNEPLNNSLYVFFPPFCIASIPLYKMFAASFISRKGWGDQVVPLESEAEDYGWAQQSTLGRSSFQFSQCQPWALGKAVSSLLILHMGIKSLTFRHYWEHESGWSGT